MSQGHGGPANLSRRTRSQGSGSTWDEVVAPHTASEKFATVVLEAETQALRQVHDARASEPGGEEPRPLGTTEPVNKADVKPPATGAGRPKKRSSGAPEDQKILLRVHTPNVAQVRKIFADVTRSAESQQRKEVQAELAKRDDDIALLRADIESLDQNSGNLLHRFPLQSPTAQPKTSACLKRRTSLVSSSRSWNQLRRRIPNRLGKIRSRVETRKPQLGSPTLTRSCKRSKNRRGLPPKERRNRKGGRPRGRANVRTLTSSRLTTQALIQLTTA